MHKLLIDENLSPSLIGLAIAKGFVCSHVNHLGLNGLKDWELKSAILEGDWIFVTNNSVDFRGPANAPGSRGVYADVELHAGLVCVDAPGGLNLELQRILLEFILDNLVSDGDLTNQLLEVYLHENGEVELSRFALPETEANPPLGTT